MIWKANYLKLTIPGNFIGPLVFLQEEKPLYTTGWIVTVSTPSYLHGAECRPVLIDVPGGHFRNVHSPRATLPLRLRPGEQKER